MDKRLFSVFLVALCIAAVNSIKVSTPLGELVGKVNDDESIAFLGVPYAKAPIGELRFQPPQSPLKWNKTLDATKNAPACIQSSQIFARPYNLSEDCLTMDIFVDGKLVNETAKMPVLVFIHGGSFVSGSSIDYNLSKFVAGKGVIGVAIQYRLGLLGFAQSPDDQEITGNNGLQDQVAALRWVQKYIEYFGGDGNKVTVAGESAGSISIAYHLVSPLAKNLMQRAILESGAHRTLPIVTGEKVTQNVRQVLSLTDCLKRGQNEQFDCLKSIPVDRLLDVQKKLQLRGISFTPTIDSRYFANTNPVEQVQNGNFTTKVDALIVGQNGNEGALFLAIYAPRIFPLTGYPRRKTWFYFELRAATPFLPQIARPTWRKVVDLTFDGRFAMNETDLANTMGQVLGDELFNCPNHEFTVAYAKANPKTNVYYYDFLSRPMLPTTRRVMPYIRDALHSDEIQFFYGFPLLNQTAYTPDEVKFSKRLTTELTTLVKSGAVADKKWPQVQVVGDKVNFSHIVFFNSVHTEYRAGFPKNYCERLKNSSRFSLF